MEHYFETHLYKPREVLVQNSIQTNTPVKSVFVESMSWQSVFNLVVETLHNPNIGVEYEFGMVVKIRKR